MLKSTFHACTYLSELELSFEQSSVSVLEEAGFVQVCLEISDFDRIISCSVVYSIKFNVSSYQQNAGNITFLEKLCRFHDVISDPELDYIPPNNTFSYSSCSKRDCFNITILDDMELEAVESFIVSLTPDGRMRNSIVFSQRTIEISILDTDGELILKL